MGDAGENLEGRIARVEQQISGVEDSIRSVEVEIRNCSDRVERKQLRTKEESLRSELARLRTKEEHLLTLQLRNREQLGTEREWLVQKVVELALPSGDVNHPSTSNKDRFCIPCKVEHWDVKDDIEAYLRNADNKKRVYDLYVTSSTERVHKNERIETDFVSIILSALVNFREKNQLGFVLKKEVSLKKEDYDGMNVDDGAAKKAGSPVRADYLVTFGGKTCFSVEIKNGGLGPGESQSWKLHEVWAEYTSKEGKGVYFESSGITQYHCVKVLRWICQLYEYMVLAKVGYGVLTDAKYWYLFKRDNAGCLKISHSFKASDEPPLLLTALSYLVSTALEDDTAYSNRVVNGRFPTLLGGDPSESSDGSLDDISRDPDYRGARTNNSGSGVRRSGRIVAAENQLALQDISAANLNFKCSGVLSCDGWSGFVFIGQLYGKPVALKFADLGTRRAEALVQEAKAYTTMKELWGRVVPALVGHGFVGSSRSVYVATELLEGSELGDVAVTKEVETASLEALDAVHACGLLHGDISPQNIMVVGGKQPSIRLLDFGFSRFKSNKKLQRVERMCLEQLLEHLKLREKEKSCYSSR